MPRSAAESRSDRGKGCAIKVHNISASIWLVSRDTVPKHITLTRLTMAARYSCTVLVSVGTVPSVSTPCAPIWVTARSTTLGQSGINFNQHVKRRTLRVCVAAWAYQISDSDWLQTIPLGLFAVWDDIPGVATPRLHALHAKRIRTTEQLNNCLQSLNVSLGHSYVASATSTNCNRKLMGLHSSCWENKPTKL